jgi:capsular exopolysaccharide synthesis family protein
MPQDAGLPDPSSDVSPTGRREPAPVAGRIEPPGLARAATAPPPALSATPDIGTLLQALRRRWALAVLLGVPLAAATALAAWFLLIPKYTAQARIQVAYTPEVILADGSHYNNGDFKTYLATAAGQIMSRRVISSALKRDEVKRLNLEARDPDVVDQVETGLNVNFKESSELVDIVMLDKDPRVATVLADAIKKAYMEDIVYAEDSRRRKRYGELEKAYNDALENARIKRENLKKEAEKNKLGTTDPKVLAERRMELLGQLRDLRQQQVQTGFKILDARANLEVFDTRMKLLKNRPASVLRDLIDKELDRDGEVRRYRDRIERLELLVEEYRRRGAESELTCRNSVTRIRELRRFIARRRATIAKHIKRSATTDSTAADAPIVRASLEKTIDTLGDLEKKIGKQIEDLLSATRPKTYDVIDQIIDEIKRDEVVIEDLGRKLKREEIELKAAPRISDYQNAELMKRETRKQILATIVAPTGVLLAVCMGLALLDFRQRRIRSAGQVSRGLGIRVVGAVPEVAHLERQLVGPSGEPLLEGQPVLESIDALRTFLLHEADARATRVVMVTSAGSGEGKTTLACHLATSLARAGRKTLLLDGDLRRPTVHELLELPVQPGLSEVLLGEVEVAEACQETHVDNLAVIPAGQYDREVLQALARDGLEGIFDKLQQEFDFIILDSHPVLPAPDSLLLGRHVDAVILSVRREVSQLPKVYAAAQRLTSLNIRVLGAVVNGTDPEDVFVGPATHAHAAA